MCIKKFNTTHNDVTWCYTRLILCYVKVFCATYILKPLQKHIFIYCILYILHLVEALLWFSLLTWGWLFEQPKHVAKLNIVNVTTCVLWLNFVVINIEVTELNFALTVFIKRAWGSVVVKALRY
jgi:hypothetical protein